MLDAASPAIKLACPTCGIPLALGAPDRLDCLEEGTSYHKIDGIWRMLPPERAAYFERFVREYETIRRSEGRSSADPAYYQSLPYRDLSGRRTRDWRIRLASFQTLQCEILPSIEERAGRPLTVIDLGAGNGWLSHRIAGRGHAVAAVDLVVNCEDGLGAHRFYRGAFTPVQAEFDHLPFVSGSVDLAVFNASLHYSTSYEASLLECRRVLAASGSLVVMDTPMYRKQESGEAMVREREQAFVRKHGFPSNALPFENFLTFDRLRDLEDGLGVRWNSLQPDFGTRWWIRRGIDRLRAGHEVASFPILVGVRRSGTSDPE